MDRKRKNGWLAQFVIAFAITLAVVIAAGHPPPARGANDPVGQDLRVAVLAFNPMLVTRSADGQLSGVAIDIANALGKTMGRSVQFLPYDSVVRFNQSIGKDEWDLAATPRDLSRVGQLAFSEPFMDIDHSYVARPGLLARTPEEVDRPGMRVGVTQGSALANFLVRNIKSAQIIQLYGGFSDARDALALGRIDVYADYTHVANRMAQEVPGASILVSRFDVVRVTIAVPKTDASSLAAINEFIKEQKRDGHVTEAIKRAGLVGGRVSRP